MPGPDSLARVEVRDVNARGVRTRAVTAGHPKKPALLLLHDFSTGMSWPRSLPTETSSATDSRGERLLSALQKEHPDKNFTIGWGGSCRLKQ